jgi:hypothetical protein
MLKFITEYREIYEFQKVAHSIFYLDRFNPQTVVFSQQVFRKAFGAYLFLRFNNWFNDPADYQRLQDFCQIIQEPTFVADAPPFYLLNPVQFTVGCPHGVFVGGFTYHADHDQINHLACGIGLRTSPETFIYGESGRWAMVNDLTHDLIIVGLESSVLEAFQASFQGQFFDIHGAIGQLEESQGAKMDRAKAAIATYGNN